jgi:hypothetical protein
MFSCALVTLYNGCHGRWRAGCRTQPKGALPKKVPCGVAYPGPRVWGYSERPLCRVLPCSACRLSGHEPAMASAFKRPLSRSPNRVFHTENVGMSAETFVCTPDADECQKSPVAKSFFQPPDRMSDRLVDSPRTALTIRHAARPSATSPQINRRCGAAEAGAGAGTDDMGPVGTGGLWGSPIWTALTPLRARRCATRVYVRTKDQWASVEVSFAQARGRVVRSSWRPNLMHSYIC